MCESFLVRIETSLITHQIHWHGRLMYMEHLRWLVLCRCWTTGLEFSAGWTATMWLSQTIQMAFKHLFFQDWDHGALW